MNPVNALLGGPVGDLVLRPWYDRVALNFVLNAYMPVSSAWAAARGAGGRDDFFDRLGEHRAKFWGLDAALNRMRILEHLYQQALTDWHDGFFGNAPTGDLVRLQAGHSNAANKLMGARSRFVAEHSHRALPKVRFAIDSPQSVNSDHGPRLADVEQAYALNTDLAEVKSSHPVERGDRVMHWLTYPAGTNKAGEPGWARVDEDRDQEPCGTLVFCHGIAMEREFWKAHYDPTDHMMTPARSHWHGLRVVRPDGPWHGRRMIDNRWGGEPILSRGPGGMLDYLEAHVREVGLLVRWARATYGGPVAVGGVSLGALTSQVVASHAKNWPEEARPDALLLLTATDSLLHAGLTGAMATGTGLDQKLYEAGWTDDLAESYGPLLDPSDDHALDPANVIAILGRTDDVVPYQAGLDLMARWHVPDDNVFHWNGGHFSTSMSVLRDQSPLDRLKAILSRLN